MGKIIGEKKFLNVHTFIIGGVEEAGKTGI